MGHPVKNTDFQGGYRPRRVSISQYEQLSAAAAEGLKRESSKSSGAIGVKLPQQYRAKTPTTNLSKTEHAVISPASSVGVSPPLRSPPRTYETTLASPHTRTVSSPPPVIPSKRRESVPLVTPGSSAPVPATIYLATPNEKVVPSSQHLVSPPISLEEVSNNYEFSSKLITSPEHAG
ncbi:hypothetical protein COOONC_19674 [Cooperia oncophora]